MANSSKSLNASLNPVSAPLPLCPSLSLVHSFVLRVKLHCAIFKLFHTICPGNLISSTRQYKTQLTQGQRSGGGRERVEREGEGECVLCRDNWELCGETLATNCRQRGEGIIKRCVSPGEWAALMAPWRKPKQGQRIYLYYSYPVKGWCC